MLLWPQQEQMKLHNTTATIQSLTLITVIVPENFLSSLKRLHKDKETHTHMHAPPHPTSNQFKNPFRSDHSRGNTFKCGMWVHTDITTVKSPAPPLLLQTLRTHGVKHNPHFTLTFDVIQSVPQHVVQF